jgi:hypothetical protein
MRSSAREEIKSALCIDEPTVRRLWDLLGRCGERVVAKSKCDDGITRHFETLDSLLSYENSRRQRITEIEISATSPAVNTSAHLYLQRVFQRYFTLETSDEGTTSAVRQGLLDAFDDAHVWYSVAAVNSPAFPLFVLLLMFGVYAPVMFLPKSLSDKHTLSGFEFAALFSYVVVIMATAALLAVIVERLRKTYFPLLTFAIGQGVARHRQAETVRWTVVGIIATVVVSVVVAAVFFWLTLRVS